MYCNTVGEKTKKIKKSDVKSTQERLLNILSFFNTIVTRLEITKISALPLCGVLSEFTLSPALSLNFTKVAPHVLALR